MKKLSLKKLFIIILAIILLIAGYFVFFQKPETAAADWWDDSWLYRQTVGITNTGTAQTDFQVMITLDSATLITANKVQSDCDDIRLTDINGKLIPHWIEPTTCNTSATKIWTKVPSISTSGDTVYLYYGNSAVDSKSSTADTFIREISGVQGAWDMDGTVGGISTGATLADSSGNTNTGTASNVNTTGMAYTSSQFEQGVDFDGVDDYINCGNKTDYNLAATSHTLEAWFLAPAKPTDDYARIFDRFTGGDPGAGYLIAMRSATGRIQIDERATGDNIWSSSVTDYADNVWHHLAYTIDILTKTGYLYIDGQQVSAPTYTGDLIDYNSNLYIGAVGSSGSFNGSIDSVRIYNTALTATEISDLYGTGGDRQGYVTTNYPNKSLVRKYSASVTIDPPTGEERGPGPVAYWKFDEGFGQTANDSTINANNGTLGLTSGVEASDPTWQTEDMCVSGKCLKFDGVDDYVEMGDSDNLSLTNAYTLSAWVNPTGTNIISLVDKGGAGGDREYRIALFNNGDVYNTDYIQILIGDSSGNWGKVWSPNVVVPKNNWSHLVMTWDNSGSGPIKVYLNGVNVANSTYINSLKNANSDLLIGASRSGSTGNPERFFNGFIDSVKIYPYARTVAQIKADYASRGTASGVSVAIGDEGKKSLSDGLVGYWKMDEASWNGTADEVIDSSGSGNDGVAVGATGKPTTGAGKFGNGGVFDGSDDYMTLPQGFVSSISNISVSAWFKTTDTDGSIAQHYGMSSNYIYMLNIVNGNISGGFGTTDNGLSSTNDYDVSYSTNVNDGNFHHAMIIYDGVTIKLYVDGVERDTANKTGNTVLNYNYGHAIGFQGYIVSGVPTAQGSGYLNGSIDEVRIYNRALSPGEVRDLYNFAPGPVGWWKMDEKVSGNGQTINDSSGYGNTGTTSSANGTGMDCMVPGKYGSGCEFDGVDDYVDLSINPDLTGGGTIMGWISVEDKISNQVIWQLRSTGASDYVSFYIYNQQIILSYHDGSYHNAGKVGIIEESKLYHVAATWEASGSNILVYVDGDKSNQASGMSNWLAAGHIIGGEAASNYWQGSIDDVRIYNYARTQAQIMEDYSAGAGRKQPIGHWKFDEGYGTTANNSGIGGSSLNGTLTNMSSPATSTSGWTDSGKMGKGLVFDGGNDYVDCGSVDSINNLGTWTIEAWTKPDVGYGQIAPRLINKGNGIRAYFSPASGKITVDTTDDNGAFQGVVTSTNAIPINEWTHIIATLNEGVSQKIRLYVNGELDNTGNELTNPTTLTSDLYIGGAATRYMNGSIDDVKIYNYALTEDEVREEYNQGALLKLGSTGTDSLGNADDSKSMEYCIPGDTSSCDPPVGEWNFEEGASSTVNDISGNNNTGTWSGTGSHWTNLGKISKGGVFNGSDDYVDCGSGGSLDITDAITIEAWVNVSSTTNQESILTKFMAGYYGYRLQFGSGRAVTFGKADDSGTFEQVASTSGIILNQWNYITVTKSGTSVNFYNNGYNIGSDTFTNSQIRISSTNFKIGAPDVNAIYFNGTIDDVRIFDYARTPAQIAWDYNRGKPVAHWKFNECQGGTAYDTSGNGNDGAITIGATVPQTVLGTCETPTDGTGAWYNGVDGKYNSSMSFDGVDDYVDCGSDSSIEMGTSDMTCLAWVKLSATQDTYAGIIGKGAGGPTSEGYMFSYYPLDDDLKFWIGDGTTRIYSGSNNNLNLNDDSWHFVAVSADRDENAVFYKDGIQVGAYNISSFNSEDITNNAVNLKVGKWGIYELDGLIDEVKIYNYALTPLQVKNAYNDGAVNFR